ncbi:hypothetical protein C475_12425 [Halosimplex carlsbadense 2-9-1]|uniref:DUF5673 domain-containing protein n=1 Tax=Halosimplex carlsbadense 2-9-1 TaxID=797114 RepID=M0CMS1_9EURY|nr:DUF5673 domain-containing protein [Halosimplex carlsbadense]ELZ24545.1 hypothetical protein C475_12425 [Halosimplex carlsbadense 2-9-1]
MRRWLRASLTAYAALLVGPAATLAPTPTWPSFAGGVTLGSALGFAVTAPLDGPEDVLTLPRVLTGFALPLGWLGPAWTGAASIPSFLFTPWAAGALAVVPWFAAVLVASEWRTRERIDALGERVVFEARKPSETRRQTRIAAAAVLGIAVVVAVVSFALGGAGESMYWLFPTLLPVWIPVLAGSDGKEVAVADGGLRVERQVHGWDTVDGYELTDDALTLTRPKWYHADLSFDSGDIEDVEAVTAALDDVLSRR